MLMLMFVFLSFVDSQTSSILPITILKFEWQHIFSIFFVFHFICESSEVQLAVEPSPRGWALKMVLWDFLVRLLPRAQIQSSKLHLEVLLGS
jgi:hypothetical protein